MFPWWHYNRTLRVFGSGTLQIPKTTHTKWLALSPSRLYWINSRFHVFIHNLARYAKKYGVGEGRRSRKKKKKKKKKKKIPCIPINLNSYRLFEPAHEIMVHVLITSATSQGSVSPEPWLFAHMKYGSERRVRLKKRKKEKKKKRFSPTGRLRMRVWRMSLRRTKRAIFLCHGSFCSNLKWLGSTVRMFGVNR